MRRYQQLSLAVLAILSLVAFVIYKHKYDHLYSVLEVLDMFGSPSSVETIATPPLTRPFEVWENHQGQLQYYGAYGDEENLSVHTLAVVKDAQILTDLKCHGNMGTVNKTGKLTWKKLATSTMVSLQCQLDDKYEILRYSDTANSFSQVIQWRKAQTHLPFAAGICTLLPSSLVQAEDIIDFVLFHHAIGVRKFVLYQRGLNPEIAKTLEDLAKEEEIKIFLPTWNIEAEGDLIIHDCGLRAVSSKNVYLPWSNYLLPDFKNEDIPTFLEKLGKSSVKKVALRSTAVCCNSSKRLLKILQASQAVNQDLPTVSVFSMSNTFSHNISAAVELIPSSKAHLYKCVSCQSSESSKSRKPLERVRSMLMESSSYFKRQEKLT